ncbi:hypothetical protein DBR28_04205 [Chryseobacterium sp. HMWF028]|nr:hypothetical protein DBR28_04205 [Chryseobacterium sp. HMWF028]
MQNDNEGDTVRNNLTNILENIPKGKSFQVSDSGNAAPNFDSNIFFKLRQLDGDQQIYLGQSILALIALNRSPAYSEKQHKSFAIDLFASLIEELNITPEELRKELDNRKEYNQD